MKNLFGGKAKKATEAAKTTIVIDNLIQIVGWESGVEGRPMVSVVDELVILTATSTKGKKAKEKSFPIKSLICTANVPKNTELYKRLQKAQGAGFVGVVFVVSKQFMKLSNKQQLVLLNLEYADLLQKENLGYPEEFGQSLKKSTNTKFTFPSNTDSIDEETDVIASLYTMSKFGVRNYKKAVSKANRCIYRSEKAAGKLMYKNNKKYQKAMAKGTVKDVVKETLDEAMEDIIDEFDDMLEDDVDEIVKKATGQKDTKQAAPGKEKEKVKQPNPEPVPAV